MDSLSKISKIQVKRAVCQQGLEENVICESLWKDSACVIIFFRRFGCIMCRVQAKEFCDKLKPILDENNVKLIGIGFDGRFVEDFIDGKFFNGDLYLDNDMECYKALNYTKFTYFKTLKSVFSKKWINLLVKSKRMGITGDFRGDRFQNGGALIIGQNGKALYEFSQEDPSDFLELETILKALNIKQKE